VEAVLGELDARGLEDGLAPFLGRLSGRGLAHGVGS
jgi:hypothetical protein